MFPRTIPSLYIPLYRRTVYKSAAPVTGNDWRTRKRSLAICCLFAWMSIGAILRPFQMLRLKKRVANSTNLKYLLAWLEYEKGKQQTKVKPYQWGGVVAYRYSHVCRTCTSLILLPFSKFNLHVFFSFFCVCFVYRFKFLA